MSLYYLQLRYYNADWGRYLNADEINGVQGQLLSYNMFAYCMNNPINNYDPDGHFVAQIIGTLNWGRICWVIRYKGCWLLRVYWMEEI